MSLITALFINKNDSNFNLNLSNLDTFYKKSSSSYKKIHLQNVNKENSNFLDNFFYADSLTYQDKSRNLFSIGNISVLVNGSIFHSPTDVEKITGRKNLYENDISNIIFYGYLKYGIEIFNFLNGHFACVILDRKKKRIIVARDRFGSDLLFFAKGEWGLAISNEIKSLLSLSYINDLPNWETVSKYILSNYRYVFGSNKTFFKQINLINPNSINIFNLEGQFLEEYELHKFQDRKRERISDKDAEKTFLELMVSSFEKRTKNLEGNYAFLLSGGLDSPTVASLAASKKSDPIISYSICYGDKESPPNELSYDERDLIQPIVKKYKMDWRPLFVSPNNFEEVYAEMCANHDEPISSPTWYSHWLLMNKINEDGIHTIFGGNGGDHALAGIYDDVPYYFADLKFQNNYELLNKEKSLWIKYHNHPVYTKNEALWNKYSETCFDWNKQGKINNYTWDEMQFRNIESYENVSLDKIKKVKNDKFPSIHNSYLLSKLHQDLVYTSSPPGARAEAINCKRFKIDLRSTFLDYDVIDFCWSLPQNLMIRDGYMKYLIRIAMKDHLPNQVVWNRKHVGLNAPVNIWFRNELKYLMNSAINWEGWEDLKILNSKKLNLIWDEHLSFKKNHMMFLWKVYSLKNWLEKIL